MLGGLAVLADRGVFPWWPVVVIAIREIGISLYRSIAGRRGIVLPAQRLGKYKAFTQYCSVGFVLLPMTEHWYTFQDIVLYAAVAVHGRLRLGDPPSRLDRLPAARDLNRATRRERRAVVRCEVLAVGTELLLGQIVDTNSAWIGEQLAASGIDSYEHRVIGDNQARIVAALRDLLSRPTRSSSAAGWARPRTT